MIHITGRRISSLSSLMNIRFRPSAGRMLPHNVLQEERATVAKVRALTDKVLVTGTDQFLDYYGSISEVKERFAQRLEQAAAECGDNRLIFAPGCSLPLDIDFEAVHQLRVVVDEYNQKR